MPQRREIPWNVQRLFAELQALDAGSTSTGRLTDSFGWKGNEAFVQHDVQELNRVLYDAIDHSLKRTDEADLIPRLFGGMFVNKVVCKSCGCCVSQSCLSLSISPLVPDLQHACGCGVQTRANARKSSSTCPSLSRALWACARASSP